MGNEKISIIIPVYNVKNYLERCLQSIIDQSHTNLEIILVDDGSVDGSSEICDKYAEIDQRIKVIHQTNKGLSGARNAGIRVATGKYIGFVDSDDYISKEMYQILYNNLIMQNADISQCLYRIVNLDNEMIQQLEYSTDEYSGDAKFENLFNKNKDITVIVCNKLYIKNIFDNLFFREGICHEDEYIIHNLLDRAKKIAFVNIELYFYFQNNESIMNKKFSLSRLDIIEALEERLIFFKNYGNEILEVCAAEDYLKRIQFYWYQTRKHYPDKKDICDSILRRYSEIYNEYKRKMVFWAKIRYKGFLKFPILNKIIKDNLKKILK